MNGLELAEVVRARLTSEVPSRVVYVGAPPDNNPPKRYLIVRTSEGSEEPTRASFTVNVQSPALWVTSVSRNNTPSHAQDEAAWGAAAVRSALRNWRPETAWALRSEASSPARRDEALPETTFYAVEQFSLRSNI